MCVSDSWHSCAHCFKTEKKFSVIHKTNSIYPFIGSYIQAHIHLFMTKSITTFPTSTQAEELFVHNLKEKFKDNGLMQLEERTEKGLI